MSLVEIVAQKPPLADGRSYYPELPLTPGSAKLVFVAADTVNGNIIQISDGKTWIQVRNVHATAAYTITIHSMPDNQKRLGHIEDYPIPAGEQHAFGPFNKNGWDQLGATGLWVQAENASLQIAAIEFP